jgi:hypothetical protein
LKGDSILGLTDDRRIIQPPGKFYTNYQYNVILLFVFKYNFILLINDEQISVNNIVCEKRHGTHGDHTKHPMNHSHVKTSQQHLHIIVCLFVGVEHHFRQYFSYIVAVSFIGGGNWSTLRKNLPVASH